MTSLSGYLRATAMAATACLLQSAPALADDGGCHFEKIADLPVTEVRDGIAIPVSVNGQAKLMLVTTASPLTYLYRQKAQSLDLVMSTPEDVEAKLAPDGAEITRVETLNIAGWQALKGRILVTDTGRSHAGDEIVGVLGEDFLKTVDVELDLQAHQLLLYRAHGCSEQSPPLPAETWGYLPFKLASPQYWSRIVFDVKVNDRPVKATLGTEYAYTRLREEAAASLGVDVKAAKPITPEFATEKGGNGLWMAKYDSVQIGDETVKHAWLPTGGGGPVINHSGNDINWLMQMKDGDWQMVLGRDFLHAHHIIISHSERRLYYSYEGGQIFTREASAQ